MSAGASTTAATFPLWALGVNAVGALFLAAGLLGVFAPAVLDAVPALQDPATAWTLLGAGIALDLGGAWAIVSHMRARRTES